jgi:hypothetical protein
MQNKKYKMSFTAGTLLHKESVTIAELYLELGDWKLTMEQAISSNILQARTTSSAKRISSETINRLKCLNDDELELLSMGDYQEQLEIVWLGICRYYPFIKDFAVEVIREKISTFSTKLNHEDFDVFFNIKLQWHEELEGIAETTRHKLRQVLFKMLVEANFLNKDYSILLSTLSPKVVNLIRQNSADELLIYPVTEINLKGYLNG